MPMIKAHILAGFSADQRAALLKALTHDVITVLGAPPRQVRCLLEEIASGNSAVAGEIDQPVTIVNVWMMEGRTEDQKAHLIAALSNSVAATTGVPLDTVRIVIFDLPKINVGIGGRSARALGR